MAGPEEQLAIAWLRHSVTPMRILVSRISLAVSTSRAAGATALATPIRAAPRLLGVETLCGSLGVVAALAVVLAVL